MRKIPHNTPSAKPASGEKIDVDRRRTDWWAILMVLVLTAVGAAIGAFILAPLYWQDHRLDLPGRCLAAAVGAAIALFPGTLLLVAYEKAKELICRRRAESRDHERG
jgi:hypothetical protein